MNFSTKEPPPVSNNNTINPTSQEQGFDEIDDEYLSQAYDIFENESCATALEQIDKLKNVIDDNKTEHNISQNLQEKENDGVADGVLAEGNHEVSSDITNNSSLRVNYLEDLITLDDLMGPIADFTNNENIPPILDLDQELNEASTTATILIMEIFGRVFENQPNKIVKDLIDEVFTRTWKIIKPKSRWRVPDPSSWKINVAKKRRADGLPYETKKTCREAKNPKPIDCSKCQYKCTNKFSEEDRMFLCRHYWSQKYSDKKKFILNLVKIMPVKTIVINRKRSTQRSNSKKYFFVLADENVQVCQKFFCHTLCISPSVITEAVNKRNHLGVYEPTFDPRGHKVPPNKTPAEKIQSVKNHIESFPKMQSHYVRKDTSREYLDCKLSIPKMYNLYLQECEKNGSEPVSENIYRKIFCTEYNLGFFVPKKDQCLICTRYERASPEKKADLEQDYRNHIARKEVCNKEKKDDKERAGKEKEFVSATFDLQAILQIPNDEVGLLYYCRKLTVYNLTIYENALPNEAYCFAWSEVNGKKGSAEIGSILLHYLSNCIPAHVKEVALFSDTCGGQNRNQYIASLLLWAVNNIHNLQIIEHKFLESGHTYMEVDSMHSSIESAKKHTAIYSMAEWLNVFRRARSSRKYKTKMSKKPYNVKEMKFDDFYDLKELAANLKINKIKNTQGKVVSWLKIKRMKYIKGEKKIFYNYDMTSNFFVIDLTEEPVDVQVVSSLPSAEHRYETRRKKNNGPSMQPPPPPTSIPGPSLPGKLTQLYKTTLPITEAKKKDLLKLCEKKIIPEEYHGWFIGLKTDSSQIDRIPEPSISDSSDED